ncbi:MAG: type II secretion system F family protein [Rhodospirillales bacterium]|nr:type II secretion system F family protein [Rhodospirillales bacterium]
MVEQAIILNIIGSVVGMIVLGGIFVAVMYVSRRRFLLRKRLNQIGVINDMAAPEKGDDRRAKRIQDKIKKLEQSSSKQRGLDALRANILQAGVSLTVSTYFVFSAILGLGSALGYLVLGYPPMGAIAVALIMGLAVPKLVIMRMASKRQAKFTKHFAEAIEIVVRGIRSGLPVNECFNVVAREFEAPLGEEFRLLVEGQNLGMSLDDLMAKGIARIPTSEYKFFAIVIQIQRQTGGNLADTLSNLSGVLRDRKKMRDKARAMAGEAIASAGIIGSLPFAVAILLSLVNPKYLMVLFTEETGQYLVAFGLFWMFLGSMVMKKMINFKM